jgi:predicted metalloprotease
LERSDEVEDRRLGPTVAGGAGLLVLIVAFIAFVISGGDAPNPLETFEDPGATDGSLPPEELEKREFVAAVVGTTETYWSAVFAAAGLEYENPSVVLFTSSTQSGCGTATEDLGPHYCPLDQTIYIDLGFFEAMETHLGAGGDYAEAYVIAHEVGHHVQTLLGVMADTRSRQEAEPTLEMSLSVALELQADCLSGTWSHYLLSRGGIVEEGDIEEALNAAAAVGDDRIQESLGYDINPETWTHGSAEQRVSWFTTGNETGRPANCATFSDVG